MPANEWDMQRPRRRCRWRGVIEGQRVDGVWVGLGAGNEVVYRPQRRTLYLKRPPVTEPGIDIDRIARWANGPPVPRVRMSRMWPLGRSDAAPSSAG